MPASIATATAKLAELKARTDSSTGYIDLLEELLELMAGAMNVFGTAATRDTGDAVGDVPLIGAGGKLAAEVVPDGLDLRSSHSELGSAVEDRSIANARHVIGHLRWNATRSKILVGDDPETDNVVGDISTTGSVFVTRSPVANFRIFVIRYRAPGYSNPVSATIDQPWGDGVFRTLQDIEVGVPSPVSFSQPMGQPSQLPLRSTATGYDLISIQGVNPDFGYVTDAESWGRGYHVINGPARRLLSEQLARKNGVFVIGDPIAGETAWASGSEAVIPIRGGPWVFRNVQNVGVWVSFHANTGPTNRGRQHRLESGKTSLVWTDDQSRVRGSTLE